jgi:hypothetical protein
LFYIIAAPVRFNISSPTKNPNLHIITFQFQKCTFNTFAKYEINVIDYFLIKNKKTQAEYPKFIVYFILTVVVFIVIVVYKLRLNI